MPPFDHFIFVYIGDFFLNDIVLFYFYAQCRYDTKVGRKQRRNKFFFS